MRDDRQRQITKAFVSLANELADEYDMVELLSGLTAHCAELLSISAAGLLLADSQGRLHVMAASSERTRHLETFQLQRDEGPCLDCYSSGSPVVVADLQLEIERWPSFAPAALSTGFRSVHAMPMRLRSTVLGALGLFHDRSGTLDEDDLNLAQALAHVAAVAIVNDKAAADQDQLNNQLQTALDSRVVLEQAKGVLSQKGGIDVDEAFVMLRRYARNHGLRLTVVAGAVVARTLPPELLLESAATTEGAANR